MNLQLAIEQLDKEWELESGFFGQLRNGIFNREGANRAIRCLKIIADAVEEHEVLDRRLVSLVWFMPLFMIWQREQLQGHGGNTDDFDNATDEIVSLLQRALGMP